MTNNQESGENPDKRRYQQELAHKTAFSALFEESAKERPTRNRIGEASGRQKDIWRTVVG